MCIAGIGNEIFKIIGVLGENYINSRSTLCGIQGIMINGFWLWKDFSMLNLIFLLYIHVSNQNNWNDLERRKSNFEFTSKFFKSILSFQTYIYLISMISPFAIFSLIYLFNNKIFEYDPILKKCDFKREYNVIIVTAFDLFILGINSILITSMFIKKIKTKHYNQSDLPPWTRFLSMMIYPAIWLFSSTCVIFSYISFNRNPDSTVDYVYHLFGPRFHTFVIPFTTGLIINKVEKLNFETTMKDIEFCKSFKYFLKERDWILQCFLDSQLISNNFDEFKQNFWETYCYEDEFTDFVKYENFDDFSENFTKENLKLLEEDLEIKLYNIFQNEYIKSDYYQKSEIYLTEFSENDSYLPLIYFIFKYILLRPCLKKKGFHSLNLKQKYLKQLRNIFPRTFELESFENSKNSRTPLLKK
eukprot:gene2326-2794_t